MQPVYFASAAAFTLLALALLIILIGRRPPTEGASDGRLRQFEAETVSLREENSDLRIRLAVEEQKSARLAELEHLAGENKTLIELSNDAKNDIEKHLATASSSLSHVESSLAEVRTRLASAEQDRDQLLSRLDTLKTEKGKVEEMLAVKIEATVRIEIAMEDLRTRLLDSQQAGGHAITALDAARQECEGLRCQLVKAQETVEQERKQAEGNFYLLAEAKDRMTREFKLLAADAVTFHGETFSKQNKEQIDAILTPLKDKLSEFQSGLQNAQTESQRERVTLAEQIRNLSQHSATMTLETSNLTRALKGQAQTQGAWGEMILSSILERSGLRENEEYVTQQSHATEDGQRLRPDVVVNLPNGQPIVIDSKLSLVAFDAYVNADTDTERALQLKRHLTSIRAHIKTLSSKEYFSAASSPLDYVVMFIPIEGALAIALQEDPSLTAEAVKAHVAIATPTTLMIALRTAANVWQVEKRNRNADSIALQAGKIYDKLVGFIEDMNSLGSRINQARTSYDEAMAKLKYGRGSLVRQVSQLKELGAKTGKSLPSNILDDSDDETALPFDSVEALATA